ncbi:MAG: hypothetical protein ABH811_02320 [archaeon]
MEKFLCNYCGYRFKSESNQVLKKCPYCEKNDIIKEPSAQDLVDEQE